MILKFNNTELIDIQDCFIKTENGIIKITENHSSISGFGELKYFTKHNNKIENINQSGYFYYKKNNLLFIN